MQRRQRRQYLAVLLLVFPTWALAQSVVGVLGIAGEIALAAGLVSS